ncbi:hypothetical protein CPLU01_15591 [Colletotrichum plurivorum]|uniref:Uncharacterized protein n=1 Tax=Colletotrichum plurivorum TaxID=2175906 RepID=A0A8H6J9F1_9PEZI|nr:hypothetical protein CPLU01_15591 [Colletotrichum plurivorum]
MTATSADTDIRDEHMCLPMTTLSGEETGPNKRSLTAVVQHSPVAFRGIPTSFSANSNGVIANPKRPRIGICREATHPAFKRGNRALLRHYGLTDTRHLQFFRLTQYAPLPTRCVREKADGSRYDPSLSGFLIIALGSRHTLVMKRSAVDTIATRTWIASGT